MEKKKISFLSRAVMMLFVMLLTASTAWADDITISSTEEWNTFASSVNSGTTYSGQTVTLAADITITTMAGTSDHKFSGTFNGSGHTLTLNLTTDGSEFTAPFRYAKGATIKFLNTAGTIYGNNQKYATGLIGSTEGTVNITACRSSVAITSDRSSEDNKDATHGGFIGVASGTVTFTNCLFDGSITDAAATNCGGFVGWRNGSLTFNSCLMAGTMTLSSTSGSATFNRNNSSNTTLNNCYYKTPIGTAQGTQATTAELADGTTATALQNGRAEDVWVQDPLTNQPMLKIFANAAYTVPSSGIGTFSAKAKFTVPDGLTAHYCKTYDKEKGTISVVAIDGVVPANTGVLLKGEPGETYTLTGTNSEAATVTDNALVAVTEQTFITQTVDIDAVNYTNFGLSDGVFKKVNSKGGTVKANRAYLQIRTSALSTTAAAEGIMLVWDEETDGIEIVQTSTVKSQHDDAWFTLDGRQLSGKPTAKGLYIVNGKKVIVK